MWKEWMNRALKKDNNEHARIVWCAYRLVEEFLYSPK
jgi:hypothetical protein